MTRVVVEPKQRGRMPSAGGDKAVKRKAVRAADAVSRVAAIRDRRRFKTTPVPTGEANRVAPADAIGTVFPSRVATPGVGERVLKDGALNSKIGGDVFKGRLKGARIFTLTLEERATCPRACDLWEKCYGNSMHLARRWTHGRELIERLEVEIAEACAAGQVLVRLHVLGDFFSTDYVAFWGLMLAVHSRLHAFGFTAWAPDTEIGRAVAAIRSANPGRFMIRHSGLCGTWGAFSIDFPTERKRLGTAIVCPEQAEAMNGGHGRHCGNCALCWHTDAPIVFVEH